MTERQWKHFWSKVRLTESCWLYEGHVAKDGYGRFNPWRPGGSKSPLLAHRLAYENLVGDVPDGLQLDHLCRVRNCVNPEHLEPVTSRVNTQRGMAAMTHCRNGHEINDKNTFFTSDGYRGCRVCQRDWRRRRSRGPHNGAKTHCPRGHTYTPENTYVKPRTGHRECRTCTRERRLGVTYTREESAL